MVFITYLTQKGEVKGEKGLDFEICQGVKAGSEGFKHNQNLHDSGVTSLVFRSWKFL